jgi:hypothetical protein
MFDLFGYPFYVLLAIIISIGIFRWYRSKDLAEPQKALVKLRYSLIIFGILVFALIFSLPLFWPAPHIHADEITTLEKAVEALQEQNEYLQHLYTRLNEFRMVLFIFLQLAVILLAVSIYNFAKALVNKDKDPGEDKTPVNILGLNDEKLTKEI